MKFEPIEVVLKNGATVCIREGNVNDAEALIDLMTIIFRESEFLLLEDGEFNMTPEQERAWLANFESIPTSLYLVTEYDGKLIGNLGITGTPIKKMKHTVSLGISLLKEWQCLGLGKRLMEEATKWVSEKTTVEIITLDVFSSNEHAISLYKKLGFVEDGRRKDFFKLDGGHYNDNITMSLHLKSRSL